MEEKENNGFAKNNGKKLLIIDLLIIGLVFIADIIISFMPVLHFGIYRSGNAWETIINLIKEMLDTKMFINTRLLFLASIICGNAIVSVIQFAGTIFSFSLEFNNLRQADKDKIDDCIIGKAETEKIKKETKFNFIVNTVFWSLISVAETIFVIFSVNYYKIVSFTAFICTIITATGVIFSIVVSFIRNYAYYNELAKREISDVNAENIKKGKPVFRIIDMVVSLLSVIVFGIISCYDFQIKMIGKPYTDFQVNYSSNNLEIENMTYDIANYDYLKEYDLHIYTIMNNITNINTQIIYSNGYLYFSHVLEKLGESVEQEKQDIMLKIAEDIVKGKISTGDLNNAVMQADLKINELTDNYEKTKEELNGVLNKMKNRAVIIKTAKYTYASGTRYIESEKVISLFYDNDLKNSEKWDDNGKIILSRTVFQYGIEFKSGTSALIYYSDGSIGNSMFIPDNIDELNNHPIGKAEMKWHDEYGSYSAMIYFDDMISKLGDLS